MALNMFITFQDLVPKISTKINSELSLESLQLYPSSAL